jgi:hypothetical protein
VDDACAREQLFMALWCLNHVALPMLLLLLLLLLLYYVFHQVWMMLVHVSSCSWPCGA